MKRDIAPRWRLAAIILCVVPALAALAPPAAAADLAAPPSTYAIDFVSTAATGIAMNDLGDVVGTRSVDPGCNPCLGITETVAWRGGSVIKLEGPPGLTAIEVRGINNAGWVVGSASPSFPGIDPHAVVWKPVGNGYQAIDLGVLPGTTQSNGTGIDDANRVVGYSSTKFFPPTGAPFVWTEAGGMVDLTTLGFPNEAPQAISPGGTVALAARWYRLDDPGSLTVMAPAPQGFFPPGVGAVINDAGDQGRFLIATSGENLAYLFRYHHEGTWQQLSQSGSGHLSRWGLGSINAAGDVSATVLSSAVIAYGPSGLAEALASRLSPAYGGADVVGGGPLNQPGQVLAQVMIGRSPRLVRMVPAEPCVTNCTAVPNMIMKGVFIEDPGNPGQCTPNAADLVGAGVRVTNEAGVVQAGAVVTGRFLDDYWLDEVKTGTTDSKGQVRFRHDGPACVGAVAFLVTDVVKGSLTLDRTSGKLTDYVIPLP